MCWILEGITFPCLGASSSLGPPVLSGAQSEGSRGELWFCVLSPQLREKGIRTISECCLQLHTLFREVSPWHWVKGECLVLV